MKILFVIGSVVVSGGNYVTFQHAIHAKEQGHDVTLAVLSRFSAAELAWHPALGELRLVDVDHLDDLAAEHYDVAVATWWKTALELYRFRARQYVYFVQSIESRFFSAQQDAMRRLVDRTYALGLPGITEATWIQTYLKTHYNADYLLARNGIRKELYVPEGPVLSPRVRGKLRVLVEGPFSVSFKNTARSVRLSRRSRADETWLLTSTPMSWYPGVQRVFSRVPITEVPRIYRSCDLVLKLSFVEGMFGPPLEMFHCGGTAVVYDVSGHDEYIVNGHNALVARMNDEAGVLQLLNSLSDDPVLVDRLKAGAREAASRWPDWSSSSATFLDHLCALREATPYDRDRLATHTQALLAEYADVLAPRAAGDSGAAVQRGLLSAGLGRLKSRLKPLRTTIEHIAEAYKPPYDHTHALQPADKPLKTGAAQ